MLVLSRRFGQDVVIGEGPGAVTVRLLHSKGGQVRLGITAPATTPIRRGELPAERAKDKADGSK
jgi:carbon storage regulator CsrA